MIGHSGSTPLFTMRFLYAVLIPCYFSQRNRICYRISGIWLEMDVAFALVMINLTFDMIVELTD